MAKIRVVVIAGPVNGARALIEILGKISLERAGGQFLGEPGTVDITHEVVPDSEYYKSTLTQIHPEDEETVSYPPAPRIGK